MFPPATINPGSANCNTGLSATAGWGGDNVRNHTGYMLMLPFLEQKAIYDKINFSLPTGLGAHTTACDPPTTTTWQLDGTDHEISIFRCPSDPQYDTPRTNDTQPYRYNRAHRTSYGFVAGGTENSTGWHVSYRAITSTAKSAWWHNGAAAMADLTDGTSNTMLMLETPLRKHSASYGPFWSHYAHTMYLYPGGYGINRIYVPTPPTTNPYNLSYAWAPGSKHPGGAQAVMGDDVVKFLSENIDMGIIRGLVSIGGNEVLGAF